MDTSKLKKFAQFARRQLIDQVSAKLDRVLAEGSTARRESLAAVGELEQEINRVQKRLAAADPKLTGAKLEAAARRQVIEQVSYTWINRFCALRFMDVNRYTNIGIVSPAEGQFQPEILTEAKMGHLDEEMIPAETRQRITAVLDGTEPSPDPQGEAFRLIVVAACNFWHSAMPFMFETIADYTELLMPDDLLSGNSILAYTREALLPENCCAEHTEQSVEVIGWLYQFYISERKDDVFAALKKGKKITPENIPAATQLFTPHWIVRYLVENSLGRLWMLNHPESKLRERMDYYIEPEAGARGEGREASKEKGNQNDSAELQRPDRVAESHGTGDGSLQSDEVVSKGRNVRSDQPGTPGGSVDTIEHRGGSRPEVDGGVQKLSVDSKRQSGGSGNSASDRTQSELIGSGDPETNDGNSNRSKQNAERPNAQLA